MTATALDLLPYAEDGVRNFPLSLEIRVPLIRRPYPRWHYVTAVVVSDDLWYGEMPTDDELRMVGSFHQEYIDHWYRKSGPWWETMQARPFDIDGGAVGRYLIKHRSGGWGYRKHTWQYGPTFVPEWNAEPETLQAVLDRVHDWGGELSPRWVEWKANHPEIFNSPAVPAGSHTSTVAAGVPSPAGGGEAGVQAPSSAEPTGGGS